MILHLNETPIHYDGLAYISPDRTQEVFNNFYRIFSIYLKPNSWTIDIGTNAGDSSLVLGRIVGPSGVVICFEPDKIAFSYLLHNINQNKLSQFHTFNVAAGLKNGKQSFAVSPSHDNGGFMSEEFSLEERGTKGGNSTVDVVDIEEFLLEKYKEEELKKISLIKIDTEGFDYQIIRRLSSIIKKTKPVIFMEWWGHISKNKQIFDTIREIDYIALRDDDFSRAEEKDFINRCENLILIPK